MSFPWIREAQKLMEDPGWQGPDTVYLLCYPYKSNAEGCTVGTDPTWLARVTPDPDWSIQRWRTGVCVNFREHKPRKYWDTKELTEPEASVYIAFDLLPVVDIDGREISSFD